MVGVLARLSHAVRCTISPCSCSALNPSKPAFQILPGLMTAGSEPPPAERAEFGGWTGDQAARPVVWDTVRTRELGNRFSVTSTVQRLKQMTEL